MRNVLSMPQVQPKARPSMSTRFDLTDLRLFVHVAEAGSITHGAVRANMTLASASERIRAMEEALSAPLLERKRRGGSAHFSRSSAPASRVDRYAAAGANARRAGQFRERAEGTCALAVEYRGHGISARTLGGLFVCSSKYRRRPRTPRKRRDCSRNRRGPRRYRHRRGDC